MLIKPYHGRASGSLCRTAARHLAERSGAVVNGLARLKTNEDSIMRTFASALIAATLVAGMATEAGAQSKGRDRNNAAGYGYRPNGDGHRPDRPCIVTGWTNWPLTKPMFECPEDNGPANRRRR
jgi:hypothetical protein